MITGFLAQWPAEKQYFPAVFDRALGFLAGKLPAGLAPGKHPIDGERIFASALGTVTEPMNSRRFELHREYIDIQVLLEGSELHGYSSLQAASPALEDRLNAEDVAFYPAPGPEAGLQTLRLQPGQYAVYLPGELHCPCCALEGPERIYKVVLKIHRNCIG